VAVPEDGVPPVEANEEISWLISAVKFPMLLTFTSVRMIPEEVSAALRNAL
jgi:hypothetical protein